MDEKLRSRKFYTGLVMISLQKHSQLVICNAVIAKFRRGVVGISASSTIISYPRARIHVMKRHTNTYDKRHRLS